MKFDNTYLDLNPFFYEKCLPEKIGPKGILMFNHKLAKELGLSELPEEEILAIFSGQKLMPGSQAYATAYCGHQFGHFNPTMGDGRAHMLGEVVANDARFDLQLKGAGRTPFSKRGDGRSWVGPVVREYILSEAMHSLKIPTTRALCSIETDEVVYRDQAYPGGIFTRVAKSHLRVGTFEYAARDFDRLKELTDYTIKRHYPELLNGDRTYFSFFQAVSSDFIKLVASWKRVGFIHGVMNTDNTSVCGITLDYGPCAFMDEFHEEKVFSSIDRYGRYRYNNQLPIALWNMSALANALFELLKFESGLSEEKLRENLSLEFEQMEKKSQQIYFQEMGKKFGLTKIESGDRQLIEKFLRDLQTQKLDFTNSFRALSELKCHDEQYNLELKHRLEGQKGGVAKAQEVMKANNPYLIPRNHQIQKAIYLVLEGDSSYMLKLVKAYANPYQKNEQYSDLTKPPTASEVVHQTFCGT